MSKVAVVTDSVTCLPAELIAELGIRIAPCGLTIDGKGYRDQVDITADEFWKRFGSIQQVSTSGALPGEFVSIFRDAGRETDRIVCILMSKAISVSYKSAVQARDIIKMENPALDIKVIDSKLVIGAEGFVALEAARAAQAGKSKEEVVQTAGDMIKRAKWVVGLRSKHTAKFGRAPDSVFEGNTPEVIPMISMLRGTGTVEDAGRANGKQASFERMTEIISENIDTGKPLHVMVHYTDIIEDGRNLMGMVKTRFNCVETYLTPYSPVLGGSSGPATAVAFYA
ncbi:MAG: DegV family EDD domain-containing protein [Dehalococcoidales bacterium]|nr:DegV family EDD domain-containing protein [Dehalococcoidales bacterium]